MENKDRKPKSNWLPTIVSILIGALITIIATWYTIYKGEQDTLKADNERYKKVKENIVSIVEEHIVNNRSIDFYCVKRLIDIQVKEENLKHIPNVADILAQAEYNILNSKHLDFKKKDEFKKVISNFYIRSISDSVLNYNKYKFPNEIKSILKAIENNQNNIAQKEFIALLEKYQTLIDKVAQSNEQAKEKKFINYLFDNPALLMITLTSYILILLLYYFLRKRKLQDKQRLMQKRRFVEYERRKLIEEIEFINKRLEHGEKLNDKEKSILKERLNSLIHRIEELENNYRQHVV